MGILKVGAGALKSVLEDQWREYFYCPSMEADVLVKKGENRKSKRSYNTKGSDNLISNGSIIAVNEGQCMMIVDQGAIVEVCAEAGEFVYDTSAEPSIFYGNLGKSIGDSFKQFGKRFTMGGDTARDQRVYFFNTKEIVGNKYGTANAVPFRVVDQNIGLDVDIAIRCHGEYSYRMVDPILFYKNICGNIEEDYTRDKIDSQLRSELLTALQPAFAKISGMGVRYSALPGHTVELANALREILSDSWDDVYGITVSKIGVSSVKASEEDEAMIKELQRNATFRNPGMAAAHLVSAQAESMQSAAKNTSTRTADSTPRGCLTWQPDRDSREILLWQTRHSRHPAVRRRWHRYPDGPVPADRKEIPETFAPTVERRNRRRADPGPAAADRRIQAISAPTAERNARMPFGPAPADRKIKETSVRTAENRDSKKCKLPGCLLGQMGSLSQIQGERKWHL